MTDRQQVASILDEIARHLELEEGGQFRARAYANAARVVGSLEVPIETFIRSGEIDRTPGIGKAIGAVIREVAERGSSSTLEGLRASTPPAMFEMMRLPGLGARKAAQIQRELGIGSIAELEAAARSGRIRALRGFGKRAEEKILQSIEMAARTGDRILLSAALRFAESLCERIAALEGVDAVEIAGSVRRRLETVEGVDLCVASADPDAALARIGELGMLAEPRRGEPGELIARGERELKVRVRACEPGELPTTLLAETGSPEFVGALGEAAASRGLRLDPRGLWKGRTRLRAAREHDVFRHVGIPFVEPELRETAEYVSRRRPPRRLVAPESLRGVFHVHTTWSDGRATLREMLDAARERGLEYVGISDHSRSAYYARGLDLDRLDLQQREIESSRKASGPMKILKGTEADILADGAIDYGDEVLGRFDFVVASVHSRFGMGRDEMTERIVRAIENPFVTFLGHPTGRLLLSREGYQLDFDRVFDAAAENGVVIEINGNPRRLDLDWRLMRGAIDRGVMLSINPDAHSTGELDHVAFGCFDARKGAVEPKHVLNARPVDEVVAYLAARRRRAIRRVGRPARA
ncbi:MAG TPA: DNA polymerase/3'-5' exonuclease PolX [Thermoanaerobaculia bacterium]|nr:DNA polymerase/3'-5' exonuclease PolX [Thermoanaerobaculia bacterium]